MPELQSRLQVALADRYRLERELGGDGMSSRKAAQIPSRTSSGESAE